TSSGSPSSSRFLRAPARRTGLGSLVAGFHPARFEEELGRDRGLGHLQQYPLVLGVDRKRGGDVPRLGGLDVVRFHGVHQDGAVRGGEQVGLLVPHPFPLEAGPYLLLAGLELGHPLGQVVQLVLTDLREHHTEHLDPPGRAKWTFGTGTASGVADPQSCPCLRRAGYWPCERRVSYHVGPCDSRPGGPRLRSCWAASF